MEKNLKLKIVASATIAALAHMSAAFAEEVVAADATAAAPAQAEAVVDNTPLNLDKIVVTGSAKKISKMKSSVSISTMNAEQVQNSGATNAAEILRSVPGVRSESSGGESNANMTVRGLPISAGGARYVQMQEDGLPILQFGDLDFATPDTFFRVDQSLDKLEVVRGGAASTSATSAPGGIMNFISKTGETKGGKIGLTAGLNFNEWRTDLSYGAPLNDNGLRFFVSGFYRNGDGLRDAGTTLENGGQIKANITQQFDNGYIRASFKHLDDQTPTNLRVPVKVTNGNISEIPGIDPRDVTFYGKNWSPDVTRNGANNLISTNVSDAFTAKTDSIGLEGSWDFAEGWNISDKFRYANNRGHFVGIHTDGTGLAADNTFTGIVFNTTLNDLSNTVNDLKLSKAFDAGTTGKFTPTIGLYTSWQNVSETWSFNAYKVNAFSNATPALLTNSTFTYNDPANGRPDGCCTRDLDAEYKTISPYASIAWEIDQLNIDASIRHDKQSANGYYVLATQAPATGPSGTFDAANRKVVDYSISHTSYSIGANYRINPNLAVFGRASNGVAFNGDRIMFGSANLNGGAIPINEADQYEAGVKWREGNLNTFVTLFKAKVDESNFDASNNTSSNAKYDNQGVEVEMGYSLGDFKIGGGLTYTDAKILNVAPGTSSTPSRQAKFVYQLTPSYRFFNKLTLVGNVIGTTGSRDNGNKIALPAFAIVNTSLRYDYSNQWQLSLSANNLFDTIGYTEADGATARAVDGRSVKASVVYSF